VQLTGEMIRLQGLVVDITKNHLEMSSKWGKAGEIFNWRLTKDQMFILIARYEVK
jgi:hypothetical protein